MPGVVEVKLDYERGQLSLDGMQLASGEYEARTWLRNSALRLGATGMYERYEVRFGRTGYRVFFGVGPERGLQLETLEREQLAVLKVVAAGDALTPWNVNHALAGQYEQISDDDARAFADAIVSLAGVFTTAQIKE